VCNAICLCHAPLMTNRRLISSGSPLEPVIGFSRAVRVGNIISVSGTAAIGVDGKTVGVGDAAAQTRRCLEIIERALHDAGAAFADVVRTRVMLRNIDDWSAVAAVHGQCFGTVRPACTVCQIASFIDPDWLVEIEADAIVN